jgi:hypothetical protein
LRPPPAMLVACSCVRRDAVACVLRPRLLLYPHGRIQTPEPCRINPSVRRSVQRLMDCDLSAVQCDCRCLLVAVPPDDDDGRPLHSSWEKEKPASSCC